MRLPHVQEWLAENPVDVLCLQETKLVDEKFPALALQELGYHVWYTGQKTYNGVALLSRLEGVDPVYDLPGVDAAQKRFLAVTINGVRVVNVYIPNGSSVGSDKYDYKLQWLEALQEFLADELTRHDKLALLGDYNIAPDDRDVHDPAAWADGVLVSEPERAAFGKLQQLGLSDAFRVGNDEAGWFSWWDYRQGAFRRNMGLRIDHILVTDALRGALQNCHIDKTPRAWERPSDHAPVIAEFSL
ncbi:putative exodeoxyribonuclease III [Magnetofaba australis IT-1]|uniref:Putative exodeoxyribonuclease III n=1 Tax=Magnetofaba australis IT-1 TaxID=1434232 RepID=A0A1Y2K3D7_9PROT|nr:putative exodeoxyribonuclease III [Magnetofaba australis IT-1]